MNDSRDFQDAELVRGGQSHFTSQPTFSPPVRDPGGILSRSLGIPSRQVFGTRMVSENFFFFANPMASSSAPYPQDSNPLGLRCIRTHITTCDG